MKTKAAQRIERINKSKSWEERLQLAWGYRPDTRFDEFYLSLADTLNYRDSHPPKKRKYFSPETGVDIEALNTDTLAAFGEDLARAMQAGNSALFREWADAIDAWHKPRPELHDRLRYALIKFCIPPKEGHKMRDIIQHLREKHLIPKTIKESAGLDDIRRNIRRLCQDLGITVKGESGRPRKLGNETLQTDKLKS